MKNELPDGWEWKKLGDISKAIQKIDPKKHPENSYIYLDIDSVDNEINRITNAKKINGKNAPSRARQIVTSGDILFSTVRIYLKNIALIEDSFSNQIASTGFCVIRPSSEVNRKFLFYYIQTNYFMKELESLQKGANYPAVRNLDVLNQLIPVPPLEIQHKIVAILEKAEETKKLRAQADELTQQLLQSVFLEMFGDPVRNPMGWEVRKLGELSTKILSGSTPKGGKQVYVKEGITFFRSQNVWKNRIEFSDIAFIDEATHNKMKKSSLKNKDILVTKTGRINTENSSLGRAALFLGENDSANINGHVYLIRLQENNIHNFILFILTTNAYRDYIRSVCVGGIDKRQINKHHLEEFPIIYPPLPLQEKFAEIVEQIEKTKQFQQHSHQQLESLFNTLMQKAFNGELVS